MQRSTSEPAARSPTPRVGQARYGQDPKAFVISANIHRRHMTKGQRAMAVAKIYPEPEKGGRGKKSVKITEFGFDSSYLSHARTVLQYAPDLADNVLSGTRKAPARSRGQIKIARCDYETVRVAPTWRRHLASGD